VELTAYQAKRGESTDEYFFKLAHVTHIIGMGKMTLLVNLAEGQDGIPNQLTRTMVGDIPATIDPMKIDAPKVQLILIPEQIVEISTSSEGICVGMLKKK
jgi:hypothetical protein